MNLLERLAELSSRFTRRQKAIAGAVAAVLVVGGAIGGTVALAGNDNAALSPITPPPSMSATPTPTPKPKPKPKPKPIAINPLTGIGHPPKGSVIAVKIDDTGNGRPQRGIDLADIVYVEQAEGGLTRLVAVYGTHKPKVEAVRSVRASDPELLAQYGPIALVASGGGGDSVTILKQSILHGILNDSGGPGFFRDGSRSAPYNLTSDLAAVSSAVNSGPSKSIGFTWAVTPVGLAARPKATSVRTQVGGTPVSFDWNGQIGRYVRVIGGVSQHAASGALIATPNVIVQYCRVTEHGGDIDVEGNPSQYTHSIGGGPAAVFRNGRRIDGSWTRSSAATGTFLRDRRGKPIALAPGGAWVILVTNGAPLSSS